MKRGGIREGIEEVSVGQVGGRAFKDTINLRTRVEGYNHKL